MAGHDRRLRPVLGLVVALLISVGWAATPASADAALPTWRGGINLYQAGVFSTQKSWLWCTAAGVQIMRNIKYHRADHSRSNQSLYFEWMRDRNRYSLPRSAGVDPQGWTAGLQRFVDVRYRLVAADSFMGALRLAVTRMRKLNLPVALAVVARQPRLGAPRVHCHGRSREDLELHDHQRPGQRAAVGPPEQQLRVRHAAQHQADRHAAQALLHEVVVRAQADDLGQQVRLDPADPADDLDLDPSTSKGLSAEVLTARSVMMCGTRSPTSQG